MKEVNIKSSIPFLKDIAEITWEIKLEGENSFMSNTFGQKLASVLPFSNQLNLSTTLPIISPSSKFKELTLVSKKKSKRWEGWESAMASQSEVFNSETMEENPFGRLTGEDWHLKASLGYREWHCLQKGKRIQGFRKTINY